ncbi:DsbA family oxidoreductase [Janibacter sp. G1551]|uniref:DsbA family oxidoreductase n=1 Tax=Janibacter sp. G1551 TaxID=3420440 RepID=UPI003D094A1C
MKIDIWSDVVCPFCYVGKRHLEQALEQFPHADDVEIEWHSFELDPNAENKPDGSLVDALAAKYGMSTEQATASQEQLAARAGAVGLDFQWRQAKLSNTFDAHRLIHLAKSLGRQDAMKERLLRAYFSEGEPVGDTDTLVRLATEIGIDEAVAREALVSGAHAEDVRRDEAQARAYGISGVPFFVIDEKYGISGAQPTEVFEQALDQAWTEAHPLTMVTPAGASNASCDGDGCSI